jgi:hypothetical protein
MQEARALSWCSGAKHQHTYEGWWVFQQNIKGSKGTLKVPSAFQHGKLLPSLQKHLQQMPGHLL